MSVSTVEGGIRHARKVITAINVQSVRRPFSRRNRPPGVSYRWGTIGVCPKSSPIRSITPRLYRFSPNPPMDGVRTAEGG